MKGLRGPVLDRSCRLVMWVGSIEKVTVGHILYVGEGVTHVAL